MEVLTHIGWIALYVFAITMIPALVVLLANFLTGLGFLIRDLRYDLNKMMGRKEEPEL